MTRSVTACLSGAARFCVRFGGTVLRDDGISFKAKAAPAPAGCSGPRGALAPIDTPR
jgi:hypothetical protein